MLFMRGAESSSANALSVFATVYRSNRIQFIQCDQKYGKKISMNKLVLLNINKTFWFICNCRKYYVILTVILKP